jgi:hypothetical protein
MRDRWWLVVFVGLVAAGCSGGGGDDADPPGRRSGSTTTAGPSGGKGPTGSGDTGVYVVASDGTQRWLVTDLDTPLTEDTATSDGFKDLIDLRRSSTASPDPVAGELGGPRPVAPGKSDDERLFVATVRTPAADGVPEPTLVMGSVGLDGELGPQVPLGVDQGEWSFDPETPGSLFGVVEDGTDDTFGLTSGTSCLRIDQGADEATVLLEGESCGFHRSGVAVAVQGDDGAKSVAIADLEGQTRSIDLPAGFAPDDFGLDGAGRLLYVTGTEGTGPSTGLDSLLVYDAEDGGEVYASRGGLPWRVLASAEEDGGLVVSRRADGIDTPRQVLVVHPDGTTATLRSALPEPLGGTTEAAWLSPDGDHAVVAASALTEDNQTHVVAEVFGRDGGAPTKALFDEVILGSFDRLWAVPDGDGGATVALQVSEHDPGTFAGDQHDRILAGTLDAELELVAVDDGRAEEMVIDPATGDLAFSTSRVRRVALVPGAGGDPVVVDASEADGKDAEVVDLHDGEAAAVVPETPITVHRLGPKADRQLGSRRWTMLYDRYGFLDADGSVLVLSAEPPVRCTTSCQAAVAGDRTLFLEWSEPPARTAYRSAGATGPTTSER